MILGYNTNGLAHHRLDEAIELLAEKGYGAVALTLDCCHLDPARATAREIQAVRNQLSDHGMRCVIETGGRYVLDPARKHRPNLLEDRSADRRVRLDWYRRAMEIGVELGACAFSFWSGTRPEEVSPEGARERLLEGLAELCESSREFGLPLAFEPEPGMWIETVDQALEFFSELGEPEQFGLTVDVGHLYVTGEGLPADVLPGVVSLLRQVHVEDIRAGIHEHLPPGEGDVDFPALWRVLDEIGFEGPVCWELSRSSHAAIEMLDRARACFVAR